MALQSTVGKAIQELYQFFFTRIEDLALAFAFLVPIVFHKLIIDMWTGVKIFIEDCLEILDIFFVAVSEEAELHYRDIFDTCAPVIINVTETTRDNAYALEAKRQSVTTALGKCFKIWKESVFTVEKKIIHPTVNLATKTTLICYAKVLEISEPAIQVTEPVWHPIVEKVIEVNEAVVYSPVLGPLVGKMENMVVDAVETVVSYCNNNGVEAPSQ